MDKDSVVLKDTFPLVGRPDRTATSIVILPNAHQFKFVGMRKHGHVQRRAHVQGHV